MMKKITYLFTMLFFVAFSWQGMAQNCGEQFLDSGGDSADYSVSENITTTISPTNGGDKVTVTFTLFDVENSWDGLMVYDGPDNTASLIDSGSTYNHTACPNGAWTGTSTYAPSYFTSTHASGSLTFVFTSDSSVTSDGWVADITCAAPPTCDAVTNLEVSSMIAPSTAGFSWDAITGATGYNFEVQPQGTAQGTAGAVGSGSSPNTSFNATALVGGTAYTVYVQTDCGGGDTATYTSLDFTFAPPPANDECSDAITLNCDDSLTAQTTLGATGGSATSCQGSIGDDIWYSFEGNDAEVTITVNSTTTDEDAQIDVYASTDGTCAGFTLGACDGSLVQSGGGNNPYDATFTAEVGTTYFIAVGNWINDYPGFNFDLSVTCVTCPAPSDLTTTDITSTVAYIDWTENGSATLWNVEYKADADFTPGNGEQDQSGSFAAHPYGLAGFQPNTTYYWYVQADCGGGDTSEWVGASFTTLSNATPDWYNIEWLTDGVNGSHTSLTVDAWTTITAYAQVYEPGVTDAAGQGAGVECWIGGNSDDTDPSTWDEDSWQEATYNVDIGNNDEYKFEHVLDFTGTVYVAARWRLEGNGPYVYGAYSGSWDGTSNNSIQLISNSIVDNDDCSGAVSLTVNSDYDCAVVTAGDLTGATASEEDEGTCFGTENDDVWYSFVATNTSHQISLLNVAGSPTDMYHSLWEGSCGTLTPAGICSDGNTSNPSGLTIGNTYFVRVNSWSSNSGATSTFDICIGTPPPPPANDACVDATPVYSLPYSMTQDALEATNNDGFIASSCVGGMNDGVWYTFTVTTAGEVTVTISGVSGWDPELAVFTGSCGSFTCEAGADSGGGSGDETVTFTAEAGTQYWVNIGYWSGSTDGLEGPFTIDITGAAVLGIANNLIDGFNMYPNPVTNTLNLNAQDQIDVVSIYNMLGQEVLRNIPSATQVQLDMSALPTGAYIVKVQAGQQIGSYNLLKQ